MVPLTVSSTLTMPGGRTVRFHGDTWLNSMSNYETASAFGATAQALGAIRHLIGGRWLNDPSMGSVPASDDDRGPTGVRVTVLDVPRSTLRAEPPAARGDYQGTFTCSAYRARRGASVPLVPGVTARAAGFDTMVLGVRRSHGPPGSATSSRSIRAPRAPNWSSRASCRESRTSCATAPAEG